MVLGITAAGKDVRPVGDDGGNTFRGGPFKLPELLSVVRVEAGDEITSHQDQLIASSDLVDDGGNVVWFLGAVGFPDDLAGFPV